MEKWKGLQTASASKKCSSVCGVYTVPNYFQNFSQNLSSFQNISKIAAIADLKACNEGSDLIDRFQYFFEKLCSAHTDTLLIGKQSTTSA